MEEKLIPVYLNCGENEDPDFCVYMTAKTIENICASKNGEKDVFFDNLIKQINNDNVRCAYGMTANNGTKGKIEITCFAFCAFNGDWM